MPLISLITCSLYCYFIVSQTPLPTLRDFFCENDKRRQHSFILDSKLNAIGYYRIGTDVIFGLNVDMYNMQCFFLQLYGNQIL